MEPPAFRESPCARWVANPWYFTSRAGRWRLVQARCGSQPMTTASAMPSQECARLAGWSDDTVVVNLQGDEPFAPPQGIRAVAELLVSSGAPMSTLATPVADSEALFDPNTVKVVRRDDGDALYFSRAPLPWARDAFARDRGTLPAGDDSWLRHIGIYGYRAGFLRKFAAMPPGRLERIESLEQLRALEAGFRIAVGMTPVAFPPGVDTIEDLERAERRLTEDAG